MDVEGKAALITGGGTGVGKATALQLASRGCSVMVNYSRSKAEAEETAAEISAKGVKGAAFQADVADDSACRALADAALAKFGRLDILVNNAGTTSFITHDDLEGVSEEDWDKIFGVNVRGTFQCTRAARAALDADGGGQIINISSVAGVGAVGSSIPYCASKAAINNMTVALARVLAPTIRVNAIAPGFITGRWLEKGLGDMYEPFKKSVEDRVPLQRVCDPEDVADAIMGVVCGSDMMTGQIIVCDGGMLIGGQ